jgi:hypothetical protein
MTIANPYSAIDTVLHAWVKAHSKKLFTSVAGRQDRFFYVSSDRGECFQISIDAPKEASVAVDAWTIETLDDRELHERWTVPIDDLYRTLDLALKKVHEWSGE